MIIEAKKLNSIIINAVFLIFLTLPALYLLINISNWNIPSENSIILLFGLPIAIACQIWAFSSLIYKLEINENNHTIFIRTLTLNKTLNKSDIDSVYIKRVSPYSNKIALEYRLILTLKGNKIISVPIHQAKIYGNDSLDRKLEILDTFWGSKIIVK